MTLYGMMRLIWISVLPRRARRVIWNVTPRPLQALRGNLVSRLACRARHDEIYDAEYFDRFVEPTMAMSCDVIAHTIIEELNPRTVVDVGCGTGLLLQSLEASGIRILGLENAAAAISTCRRRGIRVEKFDIENEPARDWDADLVVCTEVAEHLPSSCADRFVDLLTSISKNIVLSAAVPGSGGTDHVNEQPNEYWIAKLRRRGYEFDRKRSERWRQRWRTAGVAGCFARSVMIFKRAPSASTMAEPTSPACAAGMAAG